ncbi:MAG: NAD(P)H-dependent flavin oxidoreductase [Syntrophomonadaceae bacterium]|jgi:nitronate monooxygenase
MNTNGIKPLVIGDLVASIPIVQGGMGVGISLSGLASAVAAEGGIGVIAAAGIGMLEPDGYTNFLEASKRALRNEIKKARELTSGIIGVNIMVALSNFADLAAESIKQDIDVIFSGGGLPLHLPRYLDKGCRTRLVPIVSSPRAARIICKKWLDVYNYLPDGVVVEGPMAGGHLGFKKNELDDPGQSLENLVPAVKKELEPFEEIKQAPIPLIAGGGIFSGADIYKFMQLGASGVQMATRFVATHECDAAIEFKKVYVAANPEDTVIIASPVGMPGRALKNKFIEDVNAGNKKPFKCPYHCITTCKHKDSPYCIALALLNAQRGKLNHGFAFAGKSVHRVKEILSVKDLIASLMEEYRLAAQAGVI